MHLSLVRSSSQMYTVFSHEWGALLALKTTRNVKDDFHVFLLFFVCRSSVLLRMTISAIQKNQDILATCSLCIWKKKKIKKKFHQLAKKVKFTAAKWWKTISVFLPFPHHFEDALCKKCPSHIIDFFFLNTVTLRSSWKNLLIFMCIYLFLQNI